MLDVPLTATAAEISWLPTSTDTDPALASLPTFSVPPATVYLLGLLNVRAPTVRVPPSSVIVRGAVILPSSPATASGASGTTCGDQLLAVPQLPSPSISHCGGPIGTDESRS